MYSSIKIKDYKCFVKENDYQGFDVIKPINVIIGKNNSGKSKLLEALAGIVEGTEKSMTFEGYLVRPIEEDELTKFCNYHNQPRTFAYSYASSATSWDVVGQYLINQPASFTLKNSQISLKNVYPKNQNPYWKRNNIVDLLKSHLTFNPFNNYRFVHLRAERDINKEDINFTTEITKYNIQSNATVFAP